MIHAGWARCGVLATVAWPLWGCGGWVDVETTKAGDVAGEGGSAGAPAETPGAPTQTDFRYSFYVLPGIVEAGEDATQLNFVAREVSDNGALVVGTIAPIGMRIPQLPEMEDTSYWVGSRGFYWTAEGGTQPWPYDYNSPWLSGDGSAVFTFDRPATGGSILTFGRWTQAGGFQPIAEPTNTPHYFHSCSADGKRAAGYTGQAPEDSRAVLWTEGLWGDLAHVMEPTEEIPNPSAGWVSPEGSVTVVAGGGALYWAEGDDALELLSLPASDCYANPASRDGRVVFAYCEEAGVQVIYRWTAENREFVRFAAHDLPDPTYSFNADASVVAATTPFSSALLYLKDGTRISDSADEPIEIFGVSDDGSVVYLSSALSRALRWTEAGGFAPLESLAALPCTKLSMPSFPTLPFRRDLALGSSSTVSELGGGNCAWSGSRAVLWDEQGVRDIAAELTAAGVSLQGMSLRRADRYWVGDRIRIMGTGTLSSGALRTWIAEIPARD